MMHPPVELEEMLAARERRAARQTELLLQGKTLVCLLLNVPGPQKRSPLLDLVFDEGRLETERHIKTFGWQIVHFEQADHHTGLEARWVLDIDPLSVKRALCAIEEGHPLGRLFDIDVISQQKAVMRGELGFPERGCMVCGAPGRGCARNRVHTVEELSRYVQQKARSFFEERAAERIAALATESLLCEVCVTPKPGLVDTANRGAHQDMNLFSFVKSASVLTRYFREMAYIGMSTRALAPALVFPCLISAGLRAEEEMFSATGGVNTHKGAIFSLGIVCAAIGRLDGHKQVFDSGVVLTLCGEIAAGSLQNPPPQQTHGEAVRRAYGAGGVRAEAAAGFPSVRKIGLPTLERAIKSGADFNAAAVLALLALIAQVEDTNLITRVGFDRAGALRQQVAAFLSTQPDARQAVIWARQFDEQLIAENGSPGGCADLLALCLMLWHCGQRPLSQ